jgi:hypothetical protein
MDGLNSYRNAEHLRYPLRDYIYRPSRKRAKDIYAVGRTNPDTGSALPSPPNSKYPSTKLTPVQICRIAQIGLKRDMNYYGEVFLTTGTRIFQIRPEYAWVLPVVKQVDGEDRFPLSRNRLAPVFPEYALVYSRAEQTGWR